MTLTEHIRTANRRFYKLVDLQRFENWRNELNSLYLDGEISVRNGINGKIIEKHVVQHKKI